VACFSVEVGDRPRVWAFYRQAGGDLGRARPLTPRGRLNTNCGIDAHGRATVVWATDRSTDRDVGPDGLIFFLGGIEVTSRSPAGNWSRPTRLSTSDSVTPSLAVAPGGHRFVTWLQRGRWQGRRRAPGAKWKRVGVPWQGSRFQLLVPEPDGTVHALWEDRDQRMFGATRAPGGEWTAPTRSGRTLGGQRYTAAGLDAGGLLVLQTPLTPPYWVRTARYTPGG
jgi:hypothetical protein